MAGFGLTFVAAFLGARWGGATLRRVFLILLLIVAFAGQLLPESARSAVTSLLVPANALVYGAAAGIVMTVLGLLLKRRSTL